MLYLQNGSSSFSKVKIEFLRNAFVPTRKKKSREEKDFTGVSNKWLPFTINLKKVTHNFRAQHVTYLPSKAQERLGQMCS